MTESTRLPTQPFARYCSGASVRWSS